MCGDWRESGDEAWRQIGVQCWPWGAQRAGTGSGVAPTGEGVGVALTAGEVGGVDG
jgi:hypothetical protein